MNTSRRAFFLMDTIIGLVIAGILGVVLVVAITKTGQTDRRLGDGATAARIAQRAMAALHDGRPAPADLDGGTIEVRPAAGGTKVADKRWVEVVVNYQGRRATLVGLVPQGGAQ